MAIAQEVDAKMLRAQELEQDHQETVTRVGILHHALRCSIISTGSSTIVEADS